MRFPITEKKKLENELEKYTHNLESEVEKQTQFIKKEKDRLDTILHSIGDGVLVIDKDFKVVLLNAVAEKLCEINTKQAIGKHYSSIFRLENEETGKLNDGFIKTVMEKGTIQQMPEHTVLVRKDGKRITCA